MAKSFRPKCGMIVRHAGERYLIAEIPDLRQALCRNLETKENRTILLSELRPDTNQDLAAPAPNRTIDLATIAPDKLDEATARMTLMRKLESAAGSRKVTEQVAKTAVELGKTVRTVYRLRKKLEQSGTVEAFMHKERSDKGASRLPQEIEALIQESIRAELMKREFGTFEDVHTAVKRACKSKGLKPPGLTTIRDRYFKISEKERVARRRGPRKAQEQFTLWTGSFPGADRPLDVIQIDHTPSDVIVVDDAYRLPIGRAVLTIAIDVFSRMIMGFQIWLEKPSTASVALCIAHAILPKDEWLASRGIKTKWDCYGRPRKIHTDNAKEFRGSVFGRACEAYGIDVEQRPKGLKHYGGNVERAFRTFLRRMHTLNGTTFSDTKSKFDYDSSGKAIMTLAELEYWLTIYLTKRYHVKFHSKIKSTPTAKFEAGILGTDGLPGIGHPERFLDPQRVRLDFLPYEERTIQQYGVLIDHIHYHDNILSARIHEKDPKNPRRARKFIFRIDPRDVSVIYFWDPDLKEYHAIPTAHRGRPPVSLWEVRAIVKRLNAEGRSKVDENLIYEGIDEMREIERNAAAKTKAARRNEQRRAEAEKHRKQEAAAAAAKAKEESLVSDSLGAGTAAVAKPVPAPSRQPTPSNDLADDDEEILPYADVDMRS